MLIPAKVLALRTFSAWALVAHSTKSCPDRSCLTSFTVPAIPNMPLCMANGDSLEIGLSESADSIIMNHGQWSLLGTVKGSLSTERSESEFNLTNFLFVGFLLAILLMCGSPSLVPTHLGAQLGMCRAAVTSRYTPGIQGWHTRAMKRKRDVTLFDWPSGLDCAVLGMPKARNSVRSS